ncbi:MAG: HAD family hydrolase [Halanaerobiaceae bacterium]
MHYCKPHPGYYREILHKLSLTPEECIMVGNDVQEDMVAGDLGFKTYLVTDYLINRNQNSTNCDWQGSLEELYNVFLNK